MCTTDVLGAIFIHSQPETELAKNLATPNCVKIGLKQGRLKQGFVYLGRSEFRLSSTFGSRNLFSFVLSNSLLSLKVAVLSKQSR